MQPAGGSCSAADPPGKRVRLHALVASMVTSDGLAVGGLLAALLVWLLKQLMVTSPDGSDRGTGASTTVESSGMAGGLTSLDVMAAGSFCVLCVRALRPPAPPPATRSNPAASIAPEVDAAQVTSAMSR